MKTRQDKEVNNCIGVVYVKTETELTRPIWSCVVYDKKKDNDVNDCIGAVYTEIEIEL